MLEILHEALLAALKAGVAALLVMAIGVTHAANLHAAVAIGIAGIIALLAAVLAVAQQYLPKISLRAYLPAPYGAMLDSFFHASVAAFLVSIIGILNMPDKSAWRALVIAAVAGGLNAGLRAIQGALTPGESPRSESGIHGPASAIPPA